MVPADAHPEGNTNHATWTRGPPLPNELPRVQNDPFARPRAHLVAFRPGGSGVDGRPPPPPLGTVANNKPPLPPLTRKVSQVSIDEPD